MTQHKTKQGTQQVDRRVTRFRVKATVAIIMLAAGLTLMHVGPSFGVEGTPLVFREGDSRILHFDHMSRVWVVDPAVVNVVVTAFDELLIHAKEAGSTKLYVWDKRGRSEFSVVVKKRPAAEQLSLELRELLGNQLRYRVIGDNSLMIEGEVERESERERLRKIIENRAGEVEIVDLIIVKDETLTPAERSAKALREVLGEKYDYLIWDEDTVIVQGQVDSPEELERVQTIITAANEDQPFASGVVLARAEEGEPPLALIAEAIGPQYQVWQLKGKTVVVEGEADNAEAKTRLDSLLEAFADEADILNLTTVGNRPTVPLGAQRDLLQAALGEDSGIQVRVVEGKALVVEGMVADEDALARAQELLALFARVPVVDLLRVVAPNKRQVLVHVKVLDVTKGALKRHGVAWGQLQTTTTGLAVSDQPYVVRVERGLDNIYDVGALVEALAQDDEGRVLAQPSLLVNDGEEASFLAGGEVPIPVPQAGAGGAAITIEYKRYGVTLDMRPVIRPRREEGKPERIELQVKPEVSSVDLATQVSIGGLNVPAFRTRQAQTKVDIYSGQTLMIGGLLTHEQTKAVKKIPILGDLPIIGELFKHRQFTSGDAELVIFVTPEVVEPQAG